MQEVNFEDALEIITIKDPRYPRDAYIFVREALDYTQRTLVREKQGAIRHVSGQELLTGIRDYARTQFGPMAMTVLESWGIRSCQDFGELVFNMVDVGWLAKTENDTRDDFSGGYDFWEAFRKPFLPEKNQDSRSPLPDPAKAG